MKKKLIAFALLTGMGLSSFGGAQAHAASVIDHDCSDENFDLRFLGNSPYDKTEPRAKYTPSYVYMKTTSISNGGVGIHVKANGNVTSGTKYIYGPGVTLIGNRAYEDHKPWYAESVSIRLHGQLAAPSQMLGKWSPDYC